MSVEGMDKDIMNTLTEEEQTALQESEFTEEQQAAMADIAGEEGADDEAEDGDDDGAEGSAAAPIEGAGSDDDATGDKGAAAAAAAPAASSAGAEEADDEDAVVFVPRYKVDLPEDFDDQVKAINDEKLVLQQKFQDGDLDAAAYQNEIDWLNEKRDKLNDLRTRANMAEEMNRQAVQQEWDLSVQRFASKVAKTEGIDYAKDEAKWRDLDTFIKVLAADPANADKNYTWFLTEAHRRVKVLHGVAVAKDAPRDDNDTGKPAAAQKPKANEKPKRPAPVGEVPKNLSQTPGADGPGDVNGEFSDLDGLEGMELEDAIAKMTPTQRERWLKAA